MKHLSLIVLAWCCAVGAVAQTPDLMPLPQQYSMTQQDFRIARSFAIEVKGDADPRVLREATRFFQRLSERTGIFFKTWIVNENSRISDKGLLIRVDRKGKVELGDDESYRLEVKPDGIQLHAVTDIGAIRGLETLLQLTASDTNGYFFRGTQIEDRPRFAWRGLLISQPYHFMTMDVIKRTLDAMAAVKMNVLHFYISDDQGYRIESKVFPRLHELASDGLYFTHAQINEMLDYAHQRGIRVIPEIDVPGHSTAIIYAYPHLASVQRNYTLQDHWGVFDPTLDPTKETTYTFLDRLLTEVASLFPDRYFHIGGDENTGRDWKRNPEIQSFMKANGLTTTLALQNYFNKRVRGILEKNGKVAVGWDEVLMKEINDSAAKHYFETGRYDQLIETAVPKDMVIQSWRGMEALLSSAKNGYKSILSKGYYIDLVQPASYHYLTDPIPFRNEVIIPDSEANFNRFESDIIEKIKKGERLLTEQEEQLILGGEATMWTEHVTTETMDSRIWPRTAAIAERLWSAPTVRDVDDMYRRMDLISIQLEALGCTHLKNRDMMLRRLTGLQDVRALSSVVQWLEPVQGYQRNKLNNFTRFSPYTLTVDIAVPDQKAVRDLHKYVQSYVQRTDTAWKQEVRDLFYQWIASDREVQSIAQTRPALADLAVHASHLRAIATSALQVLNTRGVDKQQAVDQLNKQLSESAKPVGHCKLRVGDAMKLLLNRLQ
ncbi:MAG: beta-hexosaminidase [Bacteroidetes bacterium]|nr:beta-hexosaminidase [Bacteroidota bacterium]